MHRLYISTQADIILSHTLIEGANRLRDIILVIRSSVLDLEYYVNATNKEDEDMLRNRF